MIPDHAHQFRVGGIMLHFNVEGMKCGHSVRTIKAAVERAAPRAVVDLYKGDVTVTSDQPLDTEKVAQAITDVRL